MDRLARFESINTIIIPSKFLVVHIYLICLQIYGNVESKLLC